MPRSSRIKPLTGTYYHITNRIAGMPGEFPFGDVEKQKLVDLIKRLGRYFTVEVLGFQVMSNHYHLVCYAPEERPDSDTTAERHNRFHEDSRKAAIRPDDPKCAEIAAQMRDISCFVGRLQQQFTCWYNRTRPRRRRGILWADRFKSVVLERDTALWNCLCYIELNPVRAGMTVDPADYRFGSWGEWSATGNHPFGRNLERRLPEYQGTEARARVLEDIRRQFRVEFARIIAAETGQSTADIEQAMADADREPVFTTRLDRRVRYWTDGVIIGSRTFVLEIASAFRSDPEKHRLGKTPAGELFSWARLRRTA